MQKTLIKIHCENRDVRLVAFEIDPVGDDADTVAEVLEEIRKHEAVTYAPSGRRRGRQELTKTRYLGVLAENILINYLQDELGQNVSVTKKAYTDYSEHVDIEIQASGKVTELEVRCSFPYSRLKNVVCQYFNVIGPYRTSYKPGESAKDFYLLGLINEAVGSFNFQRKHTFYFAGGAPYSLLEAKGRRDNLKQRGANYLVLPLVQALDAIEIIDAIRSHINGIQV